MLTNHIAIVLDRSSSMSGIRYDVVNQFNNQVRTMKDQSYMFGQRTLVSLFTFSTEADTPTILDQDVFNIRELTPSQYSPSGMTAMFDSIGKTIEYLSKVPGSDEDSFLIIVITDGAENNSRKYNTSSLRSAMEKVVATDRWSFVFLVPGSGVRALQQFGIPMGNIQPWEATSYGVAQTNVQVSTGLNNYYTARSTGAKSTKSFFSPDMSNITPEDLRKALVDVTGGYDQYRVYETPRIDEYFKIVTGRPYFKGSAFYELTKPEYVQEYKKLVIQDMRTNVLYSSPGSGSVEVRRVLGMPEYGTIRLKPGNHMEYKIYVESTSLNRKLVNDTMMLVKR